MVGLLVEVTSHSVQVANSGVSKSAHITTLHPPCLTVGVTLHSQLKEGLTFFDHCEVVHKAFVL